MGGLSLSDLCQRCFVIDQPRAEVAQLVQLATVQLSDVFHGHFERRVNRAKRLRPAADVIHLGRWCASSPEPFPSHGFRNRVSDPVL